jgi:hypothetical protein
MITTHTIAFATMIRFLSLRLRGNLSCVTSARLCRRSAIMGRLPGKCSAAWTAHESLPSLFSCEARRRSASDAPQLASFVRLWRMAWVFDEPKLVQTNDVRMICCRHSDSISFDRMRRIRQSVLFRDS